MSTATRAPQRPPMDVRILQRRREVRRAGARRRRRTVLTVVLLLLGVAGAVGITRSPLFAITAVRVEGVRPAEAEVVKEAARVAKGQNLMSADLDDALARTKTLPWVADAQVRRVPPSTVVIEVRPRKPVAILAGASGQWLVDRTGVVIAEAGTQALPRIDMSSDVPPTVGSPIQDLAAQNALDLYEALPPDMQSALLAVEAVGPRTVRVQVALRRLADPPGYKKGRVVWVRMGGAGDVGEQVMVLRALLAQRRAAGDAIPSEIDVRVPGNPVVIP